ncbi:MAG: hypothetical protein ACRDTC_09050, partial [Pseudonocardiaceae bacterium]
PHPSRLDMIGAAWHEPSPLGHPLGPTTRNPPADLPLTTPLKAVLDRRCGTVGDPEQPAGGVEGEGRSVDEGIDAAQQTGRRCPPWSRRS